ncbi:hypothetical protein ACQKWADRAFT_331370 [Trichoderma austrokoningii]
MSDHEEEHPSVTASTDDLSLDSTIDDDERPMCQFGPNDMYADAKNRRMFQWYQDVIATNNPDLSLEDYIGGCNVPESSQQESTPEEKIVGLDEVTRTILQELDTSEDELIDLDEATRIVPQQQQDTSEDELIDLDEATRIIPRRVFPLVPSDATVAQAFFVSGLEYTSSNAIATYDNIAALIKALDSNLPSPPLTIFTHIVEKDVFPKTLSAKIASLWDFKDDSLDAIVPHCACARCQHNPVNNPQGLTLLTCENCLAVEYCSIGCQDADWSAHQIMYCVNPDSIPLSQFAEPHIPTFLRTSLPNPFARLSKGKWLHDRHKIDVYALLIDAFRLRESDDRWYAGLRNSCSPFRLFLNQAETKGLMPPWWSKKKLVECLDLGMDQSFDNFHDLTTMTRDVEVLVIYESPMLVMQLRMFAESVLGTGPAGTNGQLMLQKMVVAEEAARASAED